MKSFLTVDGVFREEIEIERSRFIASVMRVDTADDVKINLEKVRKEFSDATHHCYAYFIGNEQKASDDGEPQGTAGVPILETIKRNSLDKTLVIVTRYFGGIKLGAAGLLSAYMRSASEVIDKSEIAEYIYSDVATAEIDYNLYKKFSQYVINVGIILETEYNDTVKVKFAVPTDDYETVRLKLSELSAGKANLIKQESNYYKYKR